MTIMQALNHIRRALPCGLIVVAAALWLVGCTGPFGDKNELRGPPLESLHVVDTISLEDESQSPPVTIEEAATQAVEELLLQPPPPESIDLTLEEVRSAALANNLDLEVELISPSIAQATVREEEAKFESTFTGSFRQTKSDRPTSVGTEGTQSDLSQFDFGVDVPLPTGGNVGVNVPFNRSDSDNPFNLLNPAFDASLRFSISQPLLRGGGIETNTHSIRVARYERKIVDSRTKLEVIRVLANADRAYWLLYAARRELEVRQQEYELAVEQLQQARRLVAAGAVAQIEITRAESGVAQRLEGIIVARTEVWRRQRDLKRIMNRDDLRIDSPTAVVPVTQPRPSYLDLDPVRLGEYAVDNRMEMLELELQLAIAASTIDFTRNAALPLFTVDYTYNLNGLGTSFGDAFNQIADRSFNDWLVGLNAEIPLGNEAAKARVHRAILDRLQRLATRDQRTAAILQEVYDTVDQLQQNWQRILAARQEAILAGRTYEAEQRQFQIGVRTSTDVLDASAQLALAQSREVRALADYQISKVDLAFATGTLLGYGKVHWEPTDTDAR